MHRGPRSGDLVSPRSAFYYGFLLLSFICCYLSFLLPKKYKTEMQTANAVDYAVIGCYAVLMVIAGVYVMKFNRGAAEYRSEERRVGKEGRVRWWWWQYKKRV